MRDCPNIGCVLSHGHSGSCQYVGSFTPKPPETSLTSRELVAVLVNGYLDTPLAEFVEQSAALIEAWVQVREAAARAAAVRIFREQYQAAMMDTGGDREAAAYCGLQAIEKLKAGHA